MDSATPCRVSDSIGGSSILFSLAFRLPVADCGVVGLTTGGGFKGLEVTASSANLDSSFCVSVAKIEFLSCGFSGVVGGDSDCCVT